MLHKFLADFIYRIWEQHGFYGKILTTQGKISGPKNSIGRGLGVQQITIDYKTIMQLQCKVSVVIYFKKTSTQCLLKIERNIA